MSVETDQMAAMLASMRQTRGDVKEKAEAIEGRITALEEQLGRLEVIGERAARSLVILTIPVILGAACAVLGFLVYLLSVLREAL